MILALALALPPAACDRHQFADPDPGAMASAAPSVRSLPLPAPRAAAGPSTPSPSHDADVVTSAWARAVEARDWALVRAYWGDHGAASGQSPQAFAARWNKLAHPQVTLGPAEEDGAAGSLYYDQPVVIDDSKLDGSLDAAAKGKVRRLSGHVVWRRVNGVDGASPEQLRWHIESSTLAP